MGVVVEILFLQGVGKPNDRLVVLQDRAQNALLHFHVLGRQLLESDGLSIVHGTPQFFGNDGYLQIGGYRGRQANRYGEFTEASEWLVQLDIAAVDREASFLELFDDVHRRHRPEQLALLAGLSRKAEFQTLQFLGQCGSLEPDTRNAVFPQMLFMGQLTCVFRCGGDGQAPRQEVVAPVAVRHLDDITNLANVLDFMHQNDFHDYVSSRFRYWDIIASDGSPFAAFVGGSGFR